MKSTLSKFSLSLAFLAAAGLTSCAGMSKRTDSGAGSGSMHTETRSTGEPYSIEVTPMTAVNPVGTQHVLVATVRDANGNPVNHERVEWMLARGGVGEIVEIDASDAHRLCTKVDNYYAITATHPGDRILDMGTATKDDDILLKDGQTWAVITSPVEGTSHIIAYCPGIQDWNKHKVFATKHWRDVKVTMPADATNLVGTPHEMTVKIARNSDGTPLPNHIVNFRVVDGPAATLTPGGGQTASVRTNAQGVASATLELKGATPGVNHIEIQVIRPENEQCCEPAVLLATRTHTKTWVKAEIGITKTAPPTALVGATFQYQIMVKNVSPVEAADVKVTDELPAGIEYVSSSPAATVSGQTLTWNLGTMPANGQKAMTVQVKASKNGKFTNCAVVTSKGGLTARACADTVTTAPDVAIEKTGPATALMCDPITYKIKVTNNGDGPATNVRVVDNLPRGLTTQDGRSSVTFEVGTLGPKQSRDFTVAAKASESGEFTNTATATAEGGISVKDSATTKVMKPVLTVTKTGPDRRFIGRPAEFEIVVKNTGDGEARDTVLRDQVPAGATFVSATDGGVLSGNVVTWQLGTLAPNATKRVSVTLNARTALEVRNTASATAYCADTASGAAAVVYEGIPALLLEVVDNPDPIEVGSNTTYTITVTNQGSKEGRNIKIVTVLPAELEYVRAQGPTSASISGATITFAPLPNLAPGASVTWQVTVKAAKAGSVRTRFTLDSDYLAGNKVEETESTNLY